MLRVFSVAGNWDVLYFTSWPGYCKRENVMKKYEIEHIGIIVERPVEMGNWYRDVLGFNIKFSGEDETKGAAFITDANNKVMLEFGKVPNVTPLCKKIDHCLQLHIALKSDDPDKEAEYLISKGAKFVEKCQIVKPGENIIVLRDPWGNSIQLAKRPQPISV
jgi:catechol 2,3-dioxygenase-like lactoylglutathione lyase family enzyme